MVKVPGYTVAEVAAGFARLGRILREGSDSFADIVDRRQSAESFMLQGEALGFSRAQIQEIVQAVMDGSLGADVGQVRELALDLMMSGAIRAKKEDK